MFKITATQPIHEAGMKLLRENPEIAFTLARDGSEDALCEAVREADGIIARNQRLTARVLGAAPNLKAVSRCGVGVDNVDAAHLSGRGIPLMFTAGANAVSVAEHVFMMMLFMVKDTRAANRACLEGDWAWRGGWRPGELYGKTLLLLGFGHSARLVAGMASAFSMRVIAWSRSLAQSPVPGVTLTRDFRPYLPEADFISLHVPLTEETRGLLGRAEFAALKPGAFLVNAARGGIIDESLVDEALASGQLAGAAFDVFTQEPPLAHPAFFSHERSLVTPHCAGLTEESTRRMAEAAVRNLLDALNGRPDPGCVANRVELEHFKVEML